MKLDVSLVAIVLFWTVTMWVYYGPALSLIVFFVLGLFALIVKVVILDQKPNTVKGGCPIKTPPAKPIRPIKRDVKGHQPETGLRSDAPGDE